MFPALYRIFAAIGFLNKESFTWGLDCACRDGGHCARYPPSNGRGVHAATCC